MPHTHDVETGRDDVRKTFVSWSDDEPDREWAALQHLATHAPQPRLFDRGPARRLLQLLGR